VKIGESAFAKPIHFAQYWLELLAKMKGSEPAAGSSPVTRITAF